MVRNRHWPSTAAYIVFVSCNFVLPVAFVVPAGLFPPAVLPLAASAELALSAAAQSRFPRLVESFAMPVVELLRL